MVIAGRLAVHLPWISSIFQTAHEESTMVAFISACNYIRLGGFDTSMCPLKRDKIHSSYIHMAVIGKP